MKSFFQRLLRIIIWLTEQCYPESQIDSAIVSFSEVRGNGLIVQGDIKAMELREGQQVKVKASLRTKMGKKAAFQEGSVAWETSNPDVAQVTVNPEDELEATVRGLDGEANEAVVITFRADGDPDEDEVREIIGTLDVVVTQGEAVVVELSAETPSDIPEETTEEETTEEVLEGETTEEDEETSGL